MEDSGARAAQAWAMQGWVTSWEEGRKGEKNSRANDAQAWVGIKGHCTG